MGYYPNPLHPDLGHRQLVTDHLKNVISAAEMLEVPIVGTFIGKDKDKTVEQNLEEFARVWPPIVKYARQHGVKIAIENCPMIFSNDEWPGGNNLANTPYIWRKMWEIIPDDNFGLNLDPSHLVWQMIDYLRVVRDFKDRIFHVHAKDLQIDHEGLYQRGVLSSGMGWHVPRLPGLSKLVSKAQLRQYYKEEGEAQLAEAKTMLEDAGIDYEARVLVGPVAEILVAHARAKRCDMIFIGSRGMGAAGNLLLGSTVTKVLHLAGVPVLVAR